MGQTITVEEAPLVNAVDTSNGYVLEKQQLDGFLFPRAALREWRFFLPA
jgi:hypothetical protein